MNGKKFSLNDSVSHHHINGGKLNNSFVVTNKPQEKKEKTKAKKVKEKSKLNAKCCEKSSAPRKDISKDIDARNHQLLKM